MNEPRRTTSYSEEPRSHSPVSVVSRFSYEENRDSNNGDSSHPGRDSRASLRSSISASSQLSPNHIGLARPLSAAIISSNGRFTSSVTPDLARGNVLDSTEQISSVKNPIIIIEPCNFDVNEKDEGKGRSMWNPFWLWRTTLVGFVLLFVLLVIILIILYHFSNLHHGLSTQTANFHYSWTYGPTGGEILPTSDESPHTNLGVVFAFLLCLWRLVDYHCKMLQPWQEMRGRPAAPETSLLLDYISLSPISGLLQAWNSGHWAVIATNLGSCLLILLVCFPSISRPNLLTR